MIIRAGIIGLSMMLVAGVGCPPMAGDDTGSDGLASATGDGKPRTLTVADFRGETDDGFPPRRPMVINEVNADPANESAGDANGDGVSDASDDEFVELVSRIDIALDLSGLTLGDADEVRHVFPEGTIVPAGCAIVVFGGGAPTGDFGGAVVQTASTGSLNLNDDGDTVNFNSLGGELLLSYTYDNEGGNDESLTRDPDVNGPNPLVGHSGADGSGGALFSPGTRLTGRLFAGCGDHDVACEAGGPYEAECQGATTTIALDGTGSAAGEGATYLWTTNCPGASFDDDTSLTPTLTIEQGEDCPVRCAVMLTVDDGVNAVAECRARVRVFDSTPPELVGVPTEEIDADCDALPDPPEVTAVDDCDDAPTVELIESRAERDDCSDGRFTLVRTWVATDACGNRARQAQLLSVADETAPELVGVPEDVTVSCGEVPEPAEVTAIDGCDPNPEVTFERTRSEINCEERSFVITRTWTATDACGNETSASQVITVVDVPSPSFEHVAARPNVLWPPNHKMVEVTVTPSRREYCALRARCRVVSVTSNEPVNGTGDGNTEPDWEIGDGNTVLLRAERAGSGSGRVYTLEVVCVDACDDEVFDTVTVRVPHDQGDRDVHEEDDHDDDNHQGDDHDDDHGEEDDG
jgi:hypothetical protein